MWQRTFRRALGLGFCTIVVAAGPAWAEGGATVGLGGPDVAGAPLPGHGFLLPGNLILHPMVGIELGYDTNVYYEESAPTASAVVQVTTGIAASNVRAAPRLALWGGLQMRLRQYTAVASDGGRALSAAAHAGLTWRTGARLTLGLSERFERSQEAGYTRISPQITANRNTVAAAARYALPGDRLLLGADYQHSVSLYDEAPYEDAGSQSHTFIQRLSVRLRPSLIGSLSVTEQLNRYLHPQLERRESNPLSVSAALDWRPAPRLTLHGGAGWYRGDFQAGGEDLQGVVGEARGSLAIGPTGGVSVSYARAYESAIWSDFRTTDSASAEWDQAVSTRTGLRLGFSYTRRSYGVSPPDSEVERFDDAQQRVEHGVGASARLEVALRSWIRATAQARVLANVSDFEYTVIREGREELHKVSWLRGELLAGVTAEY